MEMSEIEGPDAPERHRRSPVLMMLGVALLLAACAGVAYPLWWDHNSATQGRRLLNEGFSTTTTVKPGSSLTGTHKPVVCTSSLPTAQSTSMHLAGIIEVPALQLKAPVLQGLTDPVLNVAVGHDPSSPWPGGPGEAIVEAHDVSYFSGIDSLKKGDSVVWRDACHEWTFRVISSEVSTPGVLLYPPHNDVGLALITCYPTNALFWTPDRYVVETQLVSTAKSDQGQPVPVIIPHLRVPAPPDLVAQGLTLQQNALLLNSLEVTGSPTPGWRQGPAPLDVWAVALESYIGAEKAIEQQNRTWWTDLTAPGVAMPSLWSNDARISVNVDVVGTSVHSVTLSSSAVTVVLEVRSGELLITQVSVA